MDKENGTAYLNAEDVARGFGFTRGKNGVEYVMWDRVNRYLAEFGFSALVRKSDYLPENMVYRLGFKASNEVAQIRTCRHRRQENWDCSRSKNARLIIRTAL